MQGYTGFQKATDPQNVPLKPTAIENRVAGYTGHVRMLKATAQYGKTYAEINQNLATQLPGEKGREFDFVKPGDKFLTSNQVGFSQPDLKQFEQMDKLKRPQTTHVQGLHGFSNKVHNQGQQLLTNTQLANQKADALRATKNPVYQEVVPEPQKYNLKELYGKLHQANTLITHLRQQGDNYRAEAVLPFATTTVEHLKATQPQPLEDALPADQNQGAAPDPKVAKFQPKQLSSFEPSEEAKKALLLDSKAAQQPKPLHSVHEKYQAVPLDALGETNAQREPWEKAQVLQESKSVGKPLKPREVKVPPIAALEPVKPGQDSI